MARTASKTTAVAPEPAVNTTAIAELESASRTLAVLQDGYSADRDLLNQLLGQAQMADAFAKFSGTVTTSKLSFVKENKLYRALKGQKNPARDGFLTGTWEEFCSLLGRSSEHVDRDISNLRAFGEDALESMSRMGIGYRELRQYRRLPDDQKTALVEAAKAGDKDSFLELAEDLIAKHAREKDALKKEVQDAQEQTQDLADSKKALEAQVTESLWRYVVTDHTSGAIFVWYVTGGETGGNLAETLIQAIHPRPGKVHAAQGPGALDPHQRPAGGHDRALRAGHGRPRAQGPRAARRGHGPQRLHRGAPARGRAARRRT